MMIVGTVKFILPLNLTIALRSQDLPTVIVIIGVESIKLIPSK